MKCELYNDSMQNWKKYPIQKAQLVIADVPYNIGNNFYGSNPMWYNGGDNKNGESKQVRSLIRMYIPGISNPTGMYVRVRSVYAGQYRRVIYSGWSRTVKVR